MTPTAEPEKRDAADEEAAPELPPWAERALTVGLVAYVIVLAVATYAELFENEAILRWFR